MAQSGWIVSLRIGNDIEAPDRFVGRRMNGLRTPFRFELEGGCVPICRHSFDLEPEIRLSVVPSRSWSDLVVQCSTNGSIAFFFKSNEIKNVKWGANATKTGRNRRQKENGSEQVDCNENEWSSPMEAAAVGTGAGSGRPAELGNLLLPVVFFFFFCAPLNIQQQLGDVFQRAATRDFHSFRCHYPQSGRDVLFNSSHLL